MPPPENESSVDVLSRLQDPATMDDPGPLYAWLRAHSPVHRNPTGGVYFVSRYRDAQLVLRDPAFRSLTRDELRAKQPRIARSRTLQNFLVGITNTNRPEHTRLRRAMSPFFTPQAVARLRRNTRQWCDTLLTSAAGRLRDGEIVDLHGEVTAPLAMNVMADLLGVPEPDRPFLAPLVARTLLAAHPAADDAALAGADDATLSIERYFTDLVAERRRRPRVDAVSALANGGVGADEPLDEAALINMLWGLWMSGSDSTCAAMDNATLEMFRHPRAARALADPSLVPGFVEESLRHEPPIWMAASQLVPVRDVEVAGVTIPRGAGVHVLIGSVNRDPDAFPDPDRFDHLRGTPGYLTFGAGIHQCVGAGLARMEIAVFLTELHDRLPGLVPAGRPVRRRPATQRAFDSLCVALPGRVPAAGRVADAPTSLLAHGVLAAPSSVPGDRPMAKPDTGVFAGMLFDHLRLHVADLGEATRWWADLDLTVHATGSSPTGARLAKVGRNRIRIVLDQPGPSDRRGAAYVRAHGDGVADIALHVADAGLAFHEAVRRGAVPLSPPVGHGDVVTATIAGVGDVAHTFVERRADGDPQVPSGLLPGLLPEPVPMSTPPVDPRAGLVAIDHLAVCVEAGELDRYVEFYRRVLDFEATFTERIVVGAQAVRTTAVQSRSRAVTLTLIEPDPAREPGQIDRFLHDHGGAGVQHIAFSVENIVETVGSLGRGGVRFLNTPPAYYRSLPRRLTPVRHRVDELEALDILVDVDHDGQLFQIFSRSVHPRSTLFLEIVERRGARTFGGGNITALYESVRSHEAADTLADR